MWEEVTVSQNSENRWITCSGHAQNPEEFENLDTEILLFIRFFLKPLRKFGVWYECHFSNCNTAGALDSMSPEWNVCVWLWFHPAMTFPQSFHLNYPNQRQQNPNNNTYLKESTGRRICINPKLKINKENENWNNNKFLLEDEYHWEMALRPNDRPSNEIMILNCIWIFLNKKKL